MRGTLLVLFNIVICVHISLISRGGVIKKKMLAQHPAWVLAKAHGMVNKTIIFSFYIIFHEE